MFKCLSITNLPGADVGDPYAKRSLQSHAKLERVTAYLNDIVEQSPKSRCRECRREESDVAKLDEHLQEVVKGTIVLSNQTFNDITKGDIITKSH